MPQHVPEFTDHDHIRIDDDRPLPEREGYSRDIPPMPTEEPNGNAEVWEWVLSPWEWYPNEDYDNPDAVVETWYIWVPSLRHIPSEEELNLQAAVALLEALEARDEEIHAIINAVPTRSWTIAGFTVARFDDVRRNENYQRAIAMMLRDVTAAAVRVVSAMVASHESAAMRSDSEG